MKAFLNALRLIFIMGVCLCLGALSFYWGMAEESFARASRNWPSASGKVLSSRLNRTSKNTWPIIKYEYRVGGKLFRSNIIQFGQNGSTRRYEAEATVAKYRTGKTIRVYYDPQSPARSCLEPGQIDGLGSAMSITGGFLLFALGLLILLLTLFFSIKPATKRT